MKKIIKKCSKPIIYGKIEKKSKKSNFQKK